jgi:hypothetical protein
MAAQPRWRVFTKSYIDHTEPRIGVGTIVELNSGSPKALVVDILAGNLVVLAWPQHGGRVVEYAIHRDSIHRVKDPL